MIGRRGWLKAIRILLSWLAVLSIASPALAADLPKLPEVPDLSWHGITFIGNIDVALQYETHGAPYAGMIYSPESFIGASSRQGQFFLAPNQESQSFVGIKVDERIIPGWHFVSRLEVGLIPTTGELADALKSAQKMNGILAAQQVQAGDGPRAGQIFNGEAWGGLSSDRFGTLRLGRNRSIPFDTLVTYDPLASYGFSQIGYNGTFTGQGSPETSFVDSSIKYLKDYKHFSTELIYAQPRSDARQFGQGMVGVVYPNFSVSAIGGAGTDQLLISSLAGAANLGSQFLGAKVFDTTMYGFFGKYVFHIGRHKVPAEKSFDAKLTLSGGYDHIDISNPTAGGWAPGHTTIGGYSIGPVYSTNGLGGGGIVNYGFTGGDRIVKVYFGGLKIEPRPRWTFGLAYYRYDQSSFGLGVPNLPGIVAPAYSTVACSGNAFANCSGAMQSGSFRTDYQWSKNVNLYAGVAYSRVDNGFAYGFIKTSTADPMVGARFYW